MSIPVISSLSYKDTSDDKVDAALTKLKCPRLLLGARGLISSRNTVSCLEVTMNPPSVATRIGNGNSSLFAIAARGQPSKKARAI